MTSSDWFRNGIWGKQINQVSNCIHIASENLPIRFITLSFVNWLSSMSSCDFFGCVWAVWGVFEISWVAFSLLWGKTDGFRKFRTLKIPTSLAKAIEIQSSKTMKNLLNLKKPLSCKLKTMNLPIKIFRNWAWKPCLFLANGLNLFSNCSSDLWKFNSICFLW